MKKLFTFSNIFFVVSIAACIVLAACFSSLVTWLTFLSVVAGITASKFSSKGRWLAYVFDIISFVVYAYICVTTKYYGELVLSAIVVVIHICSLFEWKKNDKDNHVIIRNIGGKEVVLSILVALVLMAAYSCGLYFWGSQYPVLNALGTICYLLGNYYGFRRSEFCFYGWLSYEAVFITLWILSAANGWFGSLLFLVGAICESVYIISGIFQWRQTAKQQQGLPVAKEDK